MKSAPAKADAGSTRRLSAPAAIRTACGTNKPTQPMRPHMETTEAVNIVAPRMTAARMRPTGIPRDLASSSGSAAAFNRQRRSSSTAAPSAAIGNPAASVEKDAPVRDPISQKVTAGSTSCGSATNFTKETSAVKKLPTTMPESTIIKNGVPPSRRRAISITSATAASPKTSAKD